jgi:hypothetical protein
MLLSIAARVSRMKQTAITNSTEAEAELQLRRCWRGLGGKLKQSLGDYIGNGIYC